MRVIRRRGWKALKGGGAIRTDDPADFVDIEIEDIELRKGHVMDRDEVFRLMEQRQAELGSDWPSDDPVWAGLYEAYKRAPVAAPEPVAKAAVPGDAVWGRICKLAEVLREEQPGELSEVESINMVLEQRPDLFREYCRRQAAGME
jgi:hypothetical protein